MHICIYALWKKIVSEVETTFFSFIVIMHEHKIYYKLSICTLRNKTEIRKDKSNCQKTILFHKTHQTLKVPISASKSTVMHVPDGVKYHSLKEKLQVHFWMKAIIEAYTLSLLLLSSYLSSKHAGCGPTDGTSALKEISGCLFGMLFDNYWSYLTVKEFFPDEQAQQP